MFADRAKIYIRSGKGGDGSTCPTADRTAVTAAGAVI